MSDADHEQLVEKLRNGGAALAVMADDFEVEATEEELRRLGGTTTAYRVPGETVEVLSATAEAQSEASAAIDEAVDEAVASMDEEAAGIAAAGASAAAIRALVAAGHLSTALHKYVPRIKM
jgi:PHD/YefM family antitoxin component YafN of YafNO toxin-antitoxin module